MFLHFLQFLSSQAEFSNFEVYFISKSSSHLRRLHNFLNVTISISLNLLSSNILNNTNLAESKYQIANGSFETGDLTGWTTSWTDENNAIGVVSSKSHWWERIVKTKNKCVLFFTACYRK